MEVYSAVLDLKRELLAMPVCLVFLQVAKKKFTFWTLHGPNFPLSVKLATGDRVSKNFFLVVFHNVKIFTQTQLLSHFHIWTRLSADE